MTVEITLVSLLEAHGLKVYPGSIPENGTYPNVVFQRVLTTDLRSHEAIEMEMPRFQLSCWAKSYKASVDTAQIVKNALNLNQTDFKLSIRVNEFDTRDQETTLFRRLLEYILWI